MKLINHKLALAICLSLGLSACTPEKTVEEYISAAKTSIDSNKVAEAAIELKNAIRLDLKNEEARYLLGTLYLDEGQAAAAEKEFVRALELGEDINVVLPPLLKALNLQNKHEEILEAITQAQGLNTDTLPTVKLYSAIANLRIGNESQAKLDVSEANEVSTESAYSRLGYAYLEAEENNLDLSLELVDGVIESSPDLLEAYLLKGQLYSGKKEYALAIESFQQYFSKVPKDLTIRLFLADAYVKNAQFEESNEHIDFLLNVLPNHAFSNQLKAVVFYESQDFENALLHADKAIQNGLNTPSNRLLAGLSAFKLEKYEVANTHLSTLSGILPKSHPAQRVLGVVQMQLGYHDKAGETLGSLEGISNEDSDMLVNASYELFQLGKNEEAKVLLDKAEKFENLNAEDITKIGIMKLSLRDLEGITDLEKALELSPELPNAKLALGIAYLTHENYDAALTHANQWIENSSNEVGGYNLAARTLFMQDKLAEAESYLNKSLAVDPENIYARLYFASKAYKEENFEESIKNIDFALKKSPSNATALLMGYQAYQALGNEPKGSELINNAAQAYSNNTSVQILSAKIAFKKGDYKKVIAGLTGIEANNELKPMFFYHLLSQSYWASKQEGNANNVVDEWISAYPESSSPVLRKVYYLELQRNLVSAMKVIDKAIKKFNKDYSLLAYKAHLSILNKEITQAKEILASIPEENSDTPFMKGLNGKILFIDKNYKDALPLLESSYEQAKSESDALLLFRIYDQEQSAEVGYQFLKQHNDSFPTHNIVKMALAELTISKDMAFAYQLYSELNQTTPNNAALLNNLAWVELKLGKLVDAKVHAEQALKIAPESEAIKDTLAEIESQIN